MATRTRSSGTGRYRRTVRSAARDRQAAELHGQGWSYQSIADELRYASKGHAHDGVQRAFRDIPIEGTEEARQLDLQRIDRLISEAWAVMERQHPFVSGGKVLPDVLDDGPVLAAIDRIRALLARRAAIYGYDAPVQRAIDVITSDTVDAEIRRLETELKLGRADDEGIGP